MKPEEKKNSAKDAPQTDEGLEATDAAENPAENAEQPDELTLLKEEAAILKDQALRAMAEVENTRRRAQRDLEDARRYAVSNFAQDLLNVLDNFYRTEEHLPTKVDNLDPSMQSLIQGIHLTKNELIKVFESHGIKRVNPLPGDPFDHNLHQAIAQVPDAKMAPNSVVQVVQAGYTLHDRLLRPAMVSVSTAA